MNAIEKNYYSKPENHIAIRNYVSSLFDNDRILEASFFCEKMLRAAPKNRYANEWAFRLAIARKDPNVEKYDEVLIKSKINENDLLMLHCKYYFVFQSSTLLKNCLNTLIDNKIEDQKHLSFIFECICWLQDADLTKKFAMSYLKKDFKIANEIKECEFKRILHIQLIEHISNIMKEKKHA